MTAALEGGEWSAARPDRTLPPGKTRYPLYRTLGGLQGRSGRAENLVPTGIRPRKVQPFVSRYTDWASRPTGLTSTSTKGLTIDSGIIAFYFDDSTEDGHISPSCVKMQNFILQQLVYLVTD